MQEAGTAVSHRRPTKERLRLARNVPLEEYRFASTVAQEAGEGVADRSRPHFAALRLSGLDRGLSRASTISSPMWSRSSAQIVKSLVEAGCRYVHIDAPGFTAYVDAPSLAADARARRRPDAEFRPLAQGRGGRWSRISAA